MIVRKSHGTCDGRVEVGGCGLLGDDVGSCFIGFPVNGSALDPRTGEGEREGLGEMVSAGVVIDLWSASEFGGDNDEG